MRGGERESVSECGAHGMGSGVNQMSFECLNLFQRFSVLITKLISVLIRSNMYTRAFTVEIFMYMQRITRTFL